MIIWRSPRKDGGVIIGIGLEAGNVKKLKEGQPLFRDLDVIGYVGASIVIMYGDTKEAMIADLEKHGITAVEGPTLGMTGAFPQGQSAPDDEGGLNMMLSRQGDQVRMDFGKEISWVSLSRHEAKEFAAKLMAMAGGTKDN